MSIEKKRTIMILGGDGYLGWSLGLAFAHRTDDNIVLVDSMIKRKWEKEVDAKLLVPLKSPAARVAAYKRLYSKNNLHFERVNLLEQPEMVKVIRKYKPNVIINAAQQPSAPFSMMSPKNAAATFSNNLVGHNNLLWAIAQTDKSIVCIKLGSAGCYMDVDTSFLPLGKKDFTFTHRGQQHHVQNAFLPMQATDFYHQSKISDFLLDDLCARLWGLKVITVQQATIFGATIPENDDPKYHELAARFNYDAIFSTVLNRFVCQVAIGHPMTVYGDGTQRTGLISLNDTIENFIRFTHMKVTPGKHQVVHNYSHRMSILEIAERIKAVEPNATINYLKNPRQEPTGGLQRTVEIHKEIRPQHSDKEQRLDNELRSMVAFTKHYAHNIDRSIILPTVSWNVTDVKQTSKPQHYAELLRTHLVRSRKHLPKLAADSTYRSSLVTSIRQGD